MWNFKKGNFIQKQGQTGTLGFKEDILTYLSVMDWIGNTTARNLRQRDVFRIVILPYKHKGIVFTWRGNTVPSKLQFNFLTRLIWRVTNMSKRFCQGSRTCHSAPPRYDNKCMSAHPHEKDNNTQDPIRACLRRQDCLSSHLSNDMRTRV